MNFLKKLFGTKGELPVKSYQDFWNWFMQNEQLFYDTVKNKDDVPKKFIDAVLEKLHQLNPQFFCLAGMKNDTCAELDISAEGDIKTFVFVEELVNAAPELQRWQFTALKPPVGIDDMSISMGGYEFNSQTLSFFNNENPGYPDEIDITIVHKDYTETNKDDIARGAFIYLDNYLGELNTATLIDHINFSDKEDSGASLVSIKKLPEFLRWREKEFVEKYEGVRHDTENDHYSAFEAEDENGLRSIAIINQELLNWDAKPSHPWMLLITITFPDGNNGMPDQHIYDLMEEFEDKLTDKLPDHAGYLNLGRETYNSTRKIFFACKEFRISSKTTAGIIRAYARKLDITYTIYKDKYWMTMDRFSNIE